MEAIGGNRHDICPTGYIALTARILSASHHRTIGFQPDRMDATGGNCHDICPLGYIALTVLIVTTGDHCAIGSQPDRMDATGSNCHDIFPAGYIALTVIIFPQASTVPSTRKPIVRAEPQTTMLDVWQ